MTYHLDRPLGQRMAGVYVSDTSNIRRLTAARRSSTSHIAALAFVFGLIVGMLAGGLVIL